MCGLIGWDMLHSKVINDFEQGNSIKTGRVMGDLGKISDIPLDAYSHLHFISSGLFVHQLCIFHILLLYWSLIMHKQPMDYTQDLCI